MTQLTPHFTLEEFTFSQTASRKGIDNTPDNSRYNVTDNLHTLARGMEDVRTLLGTPIHVSSGYRCLKLNAVLGSKSTSQHVKGLACDFTSSRYGTVADIILAIVSSDIPYDQVIEEFGSWIHISFPEDGVPPRKLALIINSNGAMIYSNPDKGKLLD